MSLSKDLNAAKAAVNKLQTYCAGLPKNSVATPKYLELNSKADKAIKKLPVGLRSMFAINLLGK